MFVSPSLQSLNSKYCTWKFTKQLLFIKKKLDSNQMNELTNEMQLKFANRINSKRMHLKVGDL